MNTRRFFDLDMSVIKSLVEQRIGDKRYDEELWRFEYRRFRYLKNISGAELHARLRAIEFNLIYLLSAARDAVPEAAAFISSWWWLKKRVQTIAEYETRHLTPPILSCEASVTTHPLFIPKHPNASTFAVRYGERWWLEPMLHQGKVRIAPASSYDDEALADAQKDNELSKPHYSPGRQVQITAEDGRVIPVIGDVEYVRPTRANYYVLCAANEFDSRLFELFTNAAGAPADACVVIWDMDTFAERLERAARSELESWFFHHNPVQYFDPRHIEPRQHVDAGMSKDFAYAYQREYRFLWMPLKGEAAQAHISLDLGSLADIAGLFATDGSCIAGRASA